MGRVWVGETSLLLSISFIHDHRVPQKINYLFLFLKSVLKFSTKNYSHGVHANTIPSIPPSCTGLIIQPLFTPPSPQHDSSRINQTLG